jgi:hypothetical protein
LRAKIGTVPFQHDPHTVQGYKRPPVTESEI